MRTADDLLDDENWTGGFYELCLLLGRADDDRLDRGLRSLWRAAGVDGCQVHRAGGPGLVAVELGAAALHQHGHLRGTVAVSSGARVVCGAFLHRDEELDTLEFYLPLGALARVDGRIGGFPFDENSGVASLTWRAPLDRWLAGIATAVHAEAPFRRALIGFEIDEERDIVKDQRCAAVLTPGTDGLDFRPANA